MLTPQRAGAALAVAGAFASAAILAPVTASASFAPHHGPQPASQVDQRAVVGSGRAFLSGLTLHPGRGQAVVRVGLPVTHVNNLTLLGKTPRGFAVVDDTGPIRFYTVETTGKRKGFARSFWKQRHSPRGVDVYLSNDGNRVLMENDGLRSGQEFTVFNIAGKKVDQILIPGNGVGLLDFTGSRALLGVDGAILDWRIGSAPTRLAGLTGSGGDIARGLLFRHTASGLDGPVALRAPRGPMRWAVPGFDPFVVSSRGTYVLGFAGRAPDAATVVRNSSDGKLRSSVALGAYQRVVGWEDNTHYLVAARGGGVTAIGRCGALSGTCQRLTSPTRSRVTLAVGSAFLKDRPR